MSRRCGQVIPLLARIGIFWGGPRGCAVHSWGATPLPTVGPPTATKSLQSENFKQEVGGLGNPRGKSPAPDQFRSPGDLDRSFRRWPGWGYFRTAPGGLLSTAKWPRPFQLWHPRPPQECDVPLYSGKSTWQIWADPGRLHILNPSEVSKFTTVVILLAQPASITT